MSRYNLRSRDKSSNTPIKIIDKEINMKDDCKKDKVVNSNTNLDCKDEDIFDFHNVFTEKDSNTLMELDEYLQKDKVILEDVDEDGACLYECLSRGLIYSNSDLVIDKKSLMNLTREYIRIHQNKLLDLPNGLKMKYYDLIELTHDMDVDNYYKKYSRMTSKNWGGLPEIIAIAEIFHIEINVYTEDSLGYKREYRIPIEKNELFNKTINLLLDISKENAHYNLIIH